MMIQLVSIRRGRTLGPFFAVATGTCGFRGSQTGDGRLPQEIQRPPQVKSISINPFILNLDFSKENNKHKLRLIWTNSGGDFDDYVGYAELFQ